MGIEKVAVLGSGVMGSGIAAHVTNAGIPVRLLDLPGSGGAERNAIAAGAVSRMLQTEPAPFMHKRNAKLIETGNLEDDLEQLADVDWIVEAVVEQLDVKRDLYARVDAVRKPGSIVSSNTSTIPLSRLTDGLTPRFRQDFLITHFFNPPRYMRLLELVAGPETRAEALEAIRRFADVQLGKGVVDCNDTPGFIANRIGVYWLQVAAMEAMALGLAVEEADAVVGPPMGIPRTGVFGLLDLVGLDLMPNVLASMIDSLPGDDPFHQYASVPELVHRLIADGYTGRKGKGGFYRLRRNGATRVKQAIDLATGEYHDAVKARPDSVAAARRGGLGALFEHPDKGGEYARRVLGRTLSYAASLVGEIADDLVAVDEAMRLGYNWKWGPFELVDRLGPPRLVEWLEQARQPVPGLLQAARESGCYRIEQGRRAYLGTDGAFHDVARAPGVLRLADVKLAGTPLERNGSASLWDLGDGVVGLEFHTKMNAIDPGVLAMTGKAVATVPKGYRALVLHNEGEQFSAGVDLGLALFTANIALWDEIEKLVRLGQETYRRLKYAPFPVVGAPSGMALGGGCEVLLHCDAIVAHAETYMGLVEVGVGVIPAWGGCKEMLQRWSRHESGPRGPMPPVSKTFESIGMATVARSAFEAKDHLFLRPEDTIVMNRDRVLAEAKQRALELAEGYAPPKPVPLSLPGPTAKCALAIAVDGLRKLGRATPHDEVVAESLAEVLSGGDTDMTVTVGEPDLSLLERRAFMRLVRHPDTLARMEHMLETGRPLRN